MAQAVVPTKSNLMNTRRQLELAESGYELLERKRKILVREMMNMIDSTVKLQKQIEIQYREAYAALQRANVTLGMCYEFAEAVPVDTSLEITPRSVMGVELPIVKLAPGKPEIHYGISATNSYLDEAYLLFEQLKHMTAELAQVQAGVCRLADAIKKTKKRTNALQYIIIPRFRQTVKFIQDALEEKEREDFSRLKVIKNRE